MKITSYKFNKTPVGACMCTSQVGLLSIEVENFVWLNGIRVIKKGDNNFNIVFPEYFDPRNVGYPVIVFNKDITKELLKIIKREL